MILCKYGMGQQVETFGRKVSDCCFLTKSHSKHIRAKTQSKYLKNELYLVFIFLFLVCEIIPISLCVLHYCSNNDHPHIKSNFVVNGSSLGNLSFHKVWTPIIFHYYYLQKVSKQFLDFPLNSLQVIHSFGYCFFFVCLLFS